MVAEVRREDMDRSEVLIVILIYALSGALVVGFAWLLTVWL